MKEQQELGIKDVSRGGAEARSVADYKFEPIRGQPMLRWEGRSTVRHEVIESVYRANNYI